MTQQENQMTEAEAGPVELVDLEKLKHDAGIPNLPTQETYWFRKAMSGAGPHAFDWSDKPHRLVFDLCRIIEAQAAAPPKGEPRVRELERTPESKPNDYCSYNHTFADTPFGRYQIEWKSWKEHPSFSLELGRETLRCPASDVASAQRYAQAHFTAAILATLEPKDTHHE